MVKEFTSFFFLFKSNYFSFGMKILKTNKRGFYFICWVVNFKLSQKCKSIFETRVKTEKIKDKVGADYICIKYA